MARWRAAPREPGLECPPAGVLLRVSQGSATPASAATSPPHRRRRPLRPRRAARGGPDPPRPPPGLGAPPPEQPLPCGGRRSCRRCIWQQSPPWIPPRASFLLRVPSAAPPRASFLLRVAAGGPLPLAPAGRARPRSSSPPPKRPGTLPPKRKLLRRPKHLPSERERAEVRHWPCLERRERERELMSDTST